MAALVQLQLNIPVHAAQQGWILNDDQKWEYLENGQPVSGCWKYINQRWYRFDDNGLMRTGWYSESPTKRYYLDSTGAMVANRWLFKDGKWFYFTQDGSAYAGYLRYNTDLYFLRPYTNDMAVSTLINVEGGPLDNPEFGQPFNEYGTWYLGARGDWTIADGAYAEVYPADCVSPVILEVS